MAEKPNIVQNGIMDSTKTLIPKPIEERISIKRKALFKLKTLLIFPGSLWELSFCEGGISLGGEKPLPPFPPVCIVGENDPLFVMRPNRACTQSAQVQAGG